MLKRSGSKNQNGVSSIVSTFGEREPHCQRFFSHWKGRPWLSVRYKNYITREKIVRNFLRMRASIDLKDGWQQSVCHPGQKSVQSVHKKQNSKEYTKGNEYKITRANIFVSTLRSGEGLGDFTCTWRKEILAKETPTFGVGLCINCQLNEFIFLTKC